MRGLVFLLVLLAWAAVGVADTARVAVASNFLITGQALADLYQTRTDHRIDLISGASGALYAQIVQGAPYDVFLSADVDRVTRLAPDHLLTPETHKPYAIGALKLWSPDTDLLFPDIEISLRRDTTLHFAMADPELAPYGRAAFEVIQALHLEDVMREKAVIGSNVGQAFAYVATGNAQMGLVALSQIIDLDGAWTSIPEGLHAPIIQQAGLLARAKGNAAAAGFYEFLGSDEAGQIIRDAGYGVPE